MTDQEIKRIVKRYLDDCASQAELRELERLLADPAHEATVKAILNDNYYELKADAIDMRAGWAVKEQLYQRIMSYRTEEIDSVGSTRNRWRVAATVAASLLIVAIMTLLYMGSQPSGEDQTAQTAILPGSNSAYLKLGDGELISLNEIGNGTIAELGNVALMKTADGELEYRPRSQGWGTDADQHHLIETPIGGQYRVRLPDGTAIWMNSATRLTYSVWSPEAEERRIELEGEAYFEVAPDPLRPFIVVAGNQVVEVLGTHFNISAYAEDRVFRTTLLEGSVKVGLSGTSVSQLLVPGEQAINTGNDLSVTKANGAYAIAWKEGYFRFNDKTLEAAMREIARWYDVRVTFANPRLKQEVLAGTISKYTSIQQVLEKMELTGAFQFEVKDREIILK